jgi:hypothetical protein
VKSVLRGWFREFVGVECAQAYLGADDPADSMAWQRARRRLTLGGFMGLVAVLVTTSTPLSSRPDPHTPTLVVVTEFRTRMALDETLGCDCGRSSTGPGRRIAPRLRLDLQLGALSNLLLAQDLAR